MTYNTDGSFSDRRDYSMLRYVTVHAPTADTIYAFLPNAKFYSIMCLVYLKKEPSVNHGELCL